ncbi:hypothetical protein [Salinispora arenicola]|uniref:hypothetical protein n=1 Tax=Salinispora arenicola TaxID=168697 RepID=UPI00036D14E2|nr:hypothetical protein [Salinispora arenicola]
MYGTMTAPQERKGKLETTTTPDTGAAHAATMTDAEVNGPSDETLDWPSLGWRQAEDTVQGLRQRMAGGQGCMFCWRGSRIEWRAVAGFGDALLGCGTTNGVPTGRHTRDCVQCR